VLRGDLVPIRVGELSNIQDLSVLHTGWDEPTWIGRGVTVGHQATIHGARIEDYCLIGIGAKILNRAVVGPEAIVGAGSLVPEGKTVPPGVLVMGTPFRVVRDLSAAEKEGLRAHAERYARMARRHAQWLAVAKD
jgi:carbonic anhydrase/acetyltransferase-like protein (isoleucine patch superfamily)